MDLSGCGTSGGVTCGTSDLSSLHCCTAGQLLLHYITFSDVYTGGSIHYKEGLLKPPVVKKN